MFCICVLLPAAGPPVAAGGTDVSSALLRASAQCQHAPMMQTTDTSLFVYFAAFGCSPSASIGVLFANKVHPATAPASSSRLKADVPEGLVSCLGCAVEAVEAALEDMNGCLRMAAIAVGRVIAEAVGVEKHRCLAGVLAPDRRHAAVTCALRPIAPRSIVAVQLSVSGHRCRRDDLTDPRAYGGDVDREPAGPRASCRFGSIQEGNSRQMYDIIAAMHIDCRLCVCTSSLLLSRSVCPTRSAPNPLIRSPLR